MYSKQFSFLIFLLMTQSYISSYWGAADTPQFFQEPHNATTQWGNVSFSIMAGAYNKWDQIDQQLRLVAAQKKKKLQKQKQEERERRQRQQETQNREERKCT